MKGITHVPNTRTSVTYGTATEVVEYITSADAEYATQCLVDAEYSEGGVQKQAVSVTSIPVVSHQATMDAISAESIAAETRRAAAREQARVQANVEYLKGIAEAREERIKVREGLLKASEDARKALAVAFRGVDARTSEEKERDDRVEQFKASLAKR